MPTEYIVLITSVIFAIIAGYATNIDEDYN